MLPPPPPDHSAAPHGSPYRGSRSARPRNPAHAATDRASPPPDCRGYAGSRPSPAPTPPPRAAPAPRPDSRTRDDPARHRPDKQVSSHPRFHRSRNTQNSTLSTPLNAGYAARRCLPRPSAPAPYGIDPAETPWPPDAAGPWRSDAPSHRPIPAPP